MAHHRIGIYYGSKLYVDLLTRVIKMHQDVEIIDLPSKISMPDGEIPGCTPSPQIIILPVLDRSCSAMDWAPLTFPQAKLLVIGERGNAGWRRMPDKNQWEELYPFGLQDLLREIRID